ncbi:MAG: XDD3 family exosortase-dependent surface protein [Pseudanabaena sp. ELA607]
MKLISPNLFAKSTLAVVAALGVAQAMPSASYAGQLINGWNYAADSTKDGANGATIGGSTNPYEIYGMGIKVTNSLIYVGVRANTGTGGTSSVKWGDLMFDLSPQSGYGNGKFEYAVRFRTDTGATAGGMQRGVYQNADGAVSLISNRFSSLNGGTAPYSAATGYVYSAFVTANGGTPKIGDLAVNDAYYPQGKDQLESMIDPNNKGTYLGGVSNLNATQLSNLGFNATAMGYPTGTTFGFSFARPSGFSLNTGYTASLFWQCLNDSVAVRRVPLPALAWGVIAAAGFGGAALARKKQKAAAQA